MDYKLNQKYFRGETARLFFTISIATILISGVLVALGFVDILSWIFVYFGMPVLLAGIIVFFVTNSLLVSDSELDNCGNALLEEYKVEFAKNNPVLNVNKQRSMSVQKEPMFFCEYYFDRQNFSMQKGRDGTFRSSDYFVSGLLMDTNKVYLAKKAVSLVEDRSEESKEEYNYSDLGKVALSDSENTNYRSVIKYHFLNFYDKDGALLYGIPINADATADTTVQKLNTAIKRSGE
ncbi:MAG: hypothetical protein CVU97_05400 [Firmicutes bacterium HGW-Firmicutes-21]|nr:MAG: hypothetical protein CVU97_05400 [Firmicutes bacterium HGW-Firmicutes-21]